MKTLRMYGSSDDLIEVEGVKGEDEYNGMTVGKSPFVTTFNVRSESEGAEIEIHVLYAGSWAFAVTTICGGNCEEMPSWPTRRSWGTDVEYSETLEIDVPDDAVIVQMDRG